MGWIKGENIMKDGIIGLSGKFVLIQHDNQLIVADLDKVLSYYTTNDEQIAVSYHHDGKITQASPVKRDSTTGAVIYRFIRNKFEESLK